MKGGCRCEPHEYWSQAFSGLYSGNWRCEGVSLRGVVKECCRCEPHEYWAPAFSGLYSGNWRCKGVSLRGVVKECVPASRMILGFRVFTGFFQVIGVVKSRQRELSVRWGFSDNGKPASDDDPALRA